MIGPHDDEKRQQESAEPLIVEIPSNCIVREKIITLVCLMI